MQHGVISHSDVSLGSSHVANKMSVLISLECRTFHKNYVIDVYSNASYFRVYNLVVVSDLGTMEHIESVVCS